MAGYFFFVFDAANNLCVRVANNFAVCFRVCCYQFSVEKIWERGTHAHTHTHTHTERERERERTLQTQTKIVRLRVRIRVCLGLEFRF